MRMAIVLCLALSALPLSAQSIETPDRADLWIAHLQNFLDDHPELSDDQRAIVFEAIGLMHTRTLNLIPSRVDSDSPSDRALRSFQRRARAAFSKDLYAEAFARFSKSVREPGRRIGAQSVDCDCNTSDDTCPVYSQGCQTWTACDWLIEGCGTFGSYWCDGLCW